MSHYFTPDHFESYLWILIAVNVCSCATLQVPIDNKTFCAVNGYTDGGTTYVTGSGVAYNYSGGLAVAESEVSGIACVRPTNAYDQCLAQRLHFPAKMIASYNAEAKGKGGLLGFLYGLIITIPIALPLDAVFNEQTKEVQKETQPMIRAAYDACNYQAARESTQFRDNASLEVT